MEFHSEKKLRLSVQLKQLERSMEFIKGIGAKRAMKKIDEV